MSGKRDYDVYVAMFRANIKEGIPLNDVFWKKAALKVQYGGSHWLKDKFLEYSPMTYNYKRK